MRTVMKMAVTASAGVLTLSACGIGGLELSQEQTAEAMLSAEEFPLEGFTRGEIDESLPEEDGDEEDSSDSIASLLEGQEVPKACEEALEATDLSGDSIVAQSKAVFTQGESSAPLPTEAEVVVATIDGDSPLESLGAVNDECEEINIEQDGLSLTMTFDELEDLEGSQISVAFGDLSVDMLMGGASEDNMIVAVVATGVEEPDVKQIVDAQITKMGEVSG